MFEPLRDDDPRHVGDYTVHHRIGSGGMGVVYLAFGRDGQAVALKIPNTRVASRPDFRRRFRTEVDAVGRIHSRHVAALVDADPDAEQPWYATQYVEGSTLADAVDAHGPLTGRVLDGCAAGLAEALVAIEAAGVVHRDLKPANIILAWDGPKIIDFGIARARDATRQTRTGTALGTVTWMAPEQIRGEQVGPASDVFAWAACVSFAATGRSPFHAETIEAVALRILYGQPDLDGLPARLASLVRTALAKDPATRPTARHLQDALTAADIAADVASASDEDDDERVTCLPIPRAAPGSPDSLAPGSPSPRDALVGRPVIGSGPRRRRWVRPVVLMAVAVALLTAVGAVAWAMLPTGHDGAVGMAGSAGTTGSTSGAGPATTTATTTATATGPTAVTGSAAVSSERPATDTTSPSTATGPNEPHATAADGRTSGTDRTGSAQQRDPAPARCGIRTVFDAEAYLRADGMSVSEYRGYDQGRSLNVMLGLVQQPAGTNIVRAYFFVGDCFVGYDAPDPSSAVTLVRAATSANPSVVLHYAGYAPGDGYCCPTGGGVDVTFTAAGPAGPVTHDGKLLPASRTAAVSRVWYPSG
ncbi:protein kinase [Frankia sp. Ag45/Mut15]|uniref:Protein kinase n=1 Tax=Frankia umida TaxID=573489 RepID=A0ABT0K420_9ACTN|nr:protein kinase [Frankia umida]MCK9878525.1 protein kinase [Frankia umida]